MNAIQTGQEIWKIPVEINLGRYGKVRVSLCRCSLELWMLDSLLQETVTLNFITR